MKNIFPILAYTLLQQGKVNMSKGEKTCKLLYTNFKSCFGCH